MCITFLAVNKHDKYKFLLLFNRDEFFHRETLPMGFHYSKDEEFKNMLFFPLDCISGGTFICLNVKNANFGCLLNNNFKLIPYNTNPNLKRADIAIDYCKLESNQDAFFEELNKNKMEYNGFNFICGNMLKGDVFYYTNNPDGTDSSNDKAINVNNQDLIGLCNAFIQNTDSVYHAKVSYGKKNFDEILGNKYTDEADFVKDLFKLMEDDTKLIEKDVDLKEGLKNPKNKNYVVSSIYVNGRVDEINFEYG